VQYALLTTDRATAVVNVLVAVAIVAFAPRVATKAVPFGLMILGWWGRRGLAVPARPRAGVGLRPRPVPVRGRGGGRAAVALALVSEARKPRPGR
jgi:hypothetical protein